MSSGKVSDKALNEASYVVGVDVGGTFTDLFVLDERDGSARIVKVPSTRGAALQPGTYNIVEIPVGEDPPGTPEEETTPPTVETGEFTVMGVDDIPPRSFYEDQVLEEGFGYITWLNIRK